MRIHRLPYFSWWMKRETTGLPFHLDWWREKLWLTSSFQRMKRENMKGENAGWLLHLEGWRKKILVDFFISRDEERKYWLTSSYRGIKRENTGWREAVLYFLIFKIFIRGYIFVSLIINVDNMSLNSLTCLYLSWVMNGGKWRVTLFIMRDA